MPRDGDERTVHNRRVDGGALLSVLAVGIEIDGLGEPLVDARDVARIREKAVGGRESGAHNPAVVGCVDTTGHEASGSARDEFPKFSGKSNERGHGARAEENAGGAHDLQNERHVRWRVEIRGEVIMSKKAFADFNEKLKEKQIIKTDGLDIVYNDILKFCTSTEYSYHLHLLKNLFFF